MTPIVPLDALARECGAAALLVKDEGRLPTGSFKARGLVMALSLAKELGVTQIAMPTNGNAGAAAAAYASRAGIEAVIFCPADTPEVNVREIAAQGARVYRVNGLIDDCGKLVRQGVKERGWFDLSTLKEPIGSRARRRWASSLPSSSTGSYRTSFFTRPAAGPA